VSLSELLQAISEDRGITTASQCEHGVREVEMVLGARWRDRWCMVVPGMANSGESARRCVGRGERAALLLLARGGRNDREQRRWTRARRV
jgi:hypothetical protein